MPVTKEYEEGYERIFGSERSKAKGRFIFDEAQQKFVPAGEYVEPPRALDAPILSGRFYESTKATDGTDIGSRTKHREYMKQNNLTVADDFKQQWQGQETKRQEFFQGGDHKERQARREQIERAIHDVQSGKKPPRRERADFDE
jgi:hypothetical protein